MSRDVKYFNYCDHIINGTAYEQSQCARCSGKGYYLDISFDINGHAILSAGNIKLQQEMLKVILDKKHKNPFQPLWGSRVHSLVGSKSLSMNKAKLEMIVREALTYLRAIQMNENQKWLNMDEDEILQSIESIEIFQLIPTGYDIRVTISNEQGDEFIQSIKI